MKKYLKLLLISAFSFYVAYTLVPTISVGSDPKNLLLIIGGLFIIFSLVDPIFSLVLLPINHLTFGLLVLILNIAFIFAVINFLPGFQVGAYDFPGRVINGIILPPVSFSAIQAILLVALIISLTQKVLHIVFE